MYVTYLLSFSLRALVFKLQNFITTRSYSGIHVVYIFYVFKYF